MNAGVAAAAVGGVPIFLVFSSCASMCVCVYYGGVGGVVWPLYGESVRTRTFL